MCGACSPPLFLASGSLEKAKIAMFLSLFPSERYGISLFFPLSMKDRFFQRKGNCASFLSVRGRDPSLGGSFLFLPQSALVCSFSSHCSELRSFRQRHGYLPPDFSLEQRNFLPLRCALPPFSLSKDCADKSLQSSSLSLSETGLNFPSLPFPRVPVPPFLP